MNNNIFQDTYIGMSDIHGRPLITGNKIKAYNKWLEFWIEGEISYMCPSFIVIAENEYYKIEDLSEIEIIAALPCKDIHYQQQIDSYKQVTIAILCLIVLLIILFIENYIGG